MPEQWTAAYFERIRPTFLECWPDTLERLSFQQIRVPLTQEEAETLAGSPAIFRQRLTPGDPRGLHSIANKLSFPIVAFSYSAFVRLGSHSPKDSEVFRAKRGLVRSPITAIKLLQTSQIVRDDLRRSLERGYVPSIFVREWMQVEPWQEFRCFQRNRELVGVTQVETGPAGSNTLLRTHSREVAAAIQDFAAKFREACPLKTVVFDVVVRSEPGQPHGFSTKLLELNPFGPETSMGLFRWGANDFDGTFRCLS